MNPVPKRIVFSGRRQVSLETFACATPGENEVLVKTQFSLMSTGTENIIFNRLFDAKTHWDEWVKYPFYPGYAAVGEVVAAGTAVSRFRAGQRVATRSGHRSLAVVGESDCFAIPDGLPFETAAWFALAKIGFHGALAGGFCAGDHILVIGAGPVGQMAARWAVALGAHSVAALDPAPLRLDLARSGGATAVIDRPAGDSREAVLDAFGGFLPNVVVDSTGNAAVFSAALELVRERGRLVLLGVTGRPSEQRLTDDVVPLGLTITGAHDNHHTAEWPPSRTADLFFRLAASGRFRLDGLNTHVFEPADCAQAYDIANTDRANTMGILFDWRSC